MQETCKHSNKLAINWSKLIVNISSIYSLWPYGSDFSSLLHVLEEIKTPCVTYGSLLAEGVGLPQGLLQGVKSRQQAVTQLQPMTDEKESFVTDALTKLLSLSLSYIFTWFAWPRRSRCCYLLASGPTVLRGRGVLTGQCVAAG